MRDLCEGELQRLIWLSETLRARLLHRFVIDPGFLKRSRVNKMKSLDRPPADAEVFRETHTRKRDRSIVEKRAEDLLPLSEPCKNRVYGAGGFFVSSLHRSDYGGSSISATSSHASPVDAEVVDLREQVQNLTQSLHSQGETLQQQIDEVRSLKETLAERDARADEQIRRLEEMQCQMAAYYDLLRAMSSHTTVGGSGGSSTDHHHHQLPSLTMVQWMMMMTTRTHRGFRRILNSERPRSFRRIRRTINPKPAMVFRRIIISILLTATGKHLPSDIIRRKLPSDSENPTETYFHRVSYRRLCVRRKIQRKPLNHRIIRKNPTKNPTESYAFPVVCVKCDHHHHHFHKSCIAAFSKKCIYTTQD
ncbi:hypothetical protein PIB30_048969 [Stylosanthes scabra]|uniref:Uncharacterized protein n=1 Tax=Stylosanthes scabra TaxID=79078 RepID=A0ABU6UG51_9FABA|nr:hypothetical protein [Stylosanthes scabra]